MNFKRLFRTPAIIFVTLYARLIFRQGVEAAERRHTLEGRTIYLASRTFRPDRLVTYNKAQFKAEKHVFGVAARLLTMNTLKRECYYHTADRFGKDKLDRKDYRIRRKAFVKERLRLAKLI